jgi:hypothetical protein
LALPGTGAIFSAPTSLVPPPPMTAPLPGMRPPEAAESAEPQPIAPPPAGANTR